MSLGLWQVKTMKQKEWMKTTVDKKVENRLQHMRNAAVAAERRQAILRQH